MNLFGIPDWARGAIVDPIIPNTGVVPPPVLGDEMRRLAQYANQYGNIAPKPFEGARYGNKDMEALEMLAMRLRIKGGEKLPFDFMQTAVAGDKTFVFIVNNGQATVLEDGSDLFPSDQLVTSIRLML